MLRKEERKENMKRTKSRIAIAVLVALTMVFTMIPSMAFAAEGGTVKVTVENATYGQGAWTGTLFSRDVKVSGKTAAKTVIDQAFDQSPAKTISWANTGYGNYITSIEGLASGAAGGYSGWMVSFNDWFADTGVDSVRVGAGEEIKIMYSLDGMGADLGAYWDNNKKSLSSLKTDVGTLSPTFNTSVKAYKLTVPAGTKSIKVTPTAANKNFQVRAIAAGKEYMRYETIPVSDGSQIIVKCGDPAWPSSNNYSGADQVAAESYVITVSYEKPGKPASVKAKSAGVSSIKVSWKKVKDADEYQVYRATSKNGKYKRVKTTKAASCTDKNRKTGKTYFYKVRACKKVDGVSYYSSYSAKVKATPKPATVALKVKAGKGSAKVTWKKVSGADGYQIYRAGSKKGKFERIKTASKKSTSYKSTKLKKGKSYYYKARAYKTVKGKKVYGSFSAVKKVKVK